MAVLEVRNIRKTFGKFVAVDDISFSLDEGVMLGLLGPNGAGKTTTIRMVMNIIIPDSGEVVLLGGTDPRENVNRIGYLPEERGLYRKMKVQETLEFLAAIKSMKSQKVRENIRYWFERLEMGGWEQKKLEELSKGMQQKVLFVATVMHEPSLLILDEPFMGLDPINTGVIKDILLELKRKGTAIIFSTHLMEHAEKLCDDILLIDKGQAVLSGPQREIKKQFGSHNIHLEYSGGDGFLDATDLIRKYDNYGQYVEIHPAEGADPQEILRYAAEKVTVEKFEIVEPSLNEIFVQAVQKIKKEN